MKLLLIVPDGVALRNYIYSSFVDELQKKEVEVMIYHQTSKSALKEIETLHKGISIVKEIPFYSESMFANLLRESLAYARLLMNKRILQNDTIMAFWNKNQKTIKRKILYRFAEFLGTLFSKSYTFILKGDAVYSSITGKNQMIKAIDNDLKLFNPDLILNLHPRAVVSEPIAVVAKKHNIKSATVIFSWDNVPKARLISRYDSYLVWSDLMKKELCLLYKEIKENQVKVVGTPQFDFYFQEALYESKSEFFSKYGLNPDKKTICFSANDQSSPYDQLYLEDVCEQINAIAIEKRPQILFRRSPVDASDRFDKVLDTYKELIIPINPDWRFEEGQQKEFSTIYPSINDSKLLVNTVKHSDLVINLGSTMAHDFAVLNKPCLYLNYNPVINSTFDVAMVFKFQHFESMNGLEAVGWINSKEEIVSKIFEAIHSPKNIGKDRIEWMKRIVKYPLQDCSKNIVKELIN
jgi:hypothetical protein